VFILKHKKKTVELEERKKDFCFFFYTKVTAGLFVNEI
jgi:hypothetical protein